MCVRRRKERGVADARHLKQARVPEIKHLEEFDWSFNPKLPKALIFDLATARFVTQHGGVLLLVNLQEQEIIERIYLWKEINVHHRVLIRCALISFHNTSQ